MNIKLTVKYSLILFAITALVGFVFSFVGGVIYCGFAPCETPIPIWVNVAKALSVLLSIVICFVIFSKNNKEIAWPLGGQVVIIVWLASYPINVMLMGISQQRWFASLIGLVVAMTLGIIIGQRLKSKEEVAPKNV